MVACKIQKIEICDKKVKNMTKFVFCKYCLELNHCILISIWEKRVVLNFYASVIVFHQGQSWPKNAENGGKDCFYAKSNWITLNVKNVLFIKSTEIPTSVWKRFTFYRKLKKDEKWI